MEEILVDTVNGTMSKNEIHPSAVIASGAKIGCGVHIGPWCIVGPDVIIEDGVQLISNVIVDGHTVLGKDSVYYPFSTIGLAPQDLKYKGEPTRCVVGRGTVVREQVTIHRGTASGNGITTVGSDCLIMVNAHVAHDCHIGNRVILVNNVVLGGHVYIDDDARIMGSAAIHQFVRIGKAALVGGVTGVESDVIPYGSVLGNRARLVGMHWIWLKRNGVQHDDIHVLRSVYRTLFPKDEDQCSVFEERLQIVKEKFGYMNRVQEIINFIEQPSRRGLVKVGRAISSSEKEE